jgi:mono/diheme cytochrome c family protein
MNDSRNRRVWAPSLLAIAAVWPLAAASQPVRERFGNMPSYGASLSEAQIKAVADYVARASAAK